MSKTGKGRKWSYQDNLSFDIRPFLFSFYISLSKPEIKLLFFADLNLHCGNRSLNNIFLGLHCSSVL
jgi:hypothetical protein